MKLRWRRAFVGTELPKAEATTVIIIAFMRSVSRAPFAFMLPTKLERLVRTIAEWEVVALTQFQFRSIVNRSWVQAHG